jgi:hypothetical protein
MILSIALLAGCASTRVATSAKQIETAVASLQADLSTFQTSVRLVQAHEASLATRSFIASDIFAGVVEQVETRQSLLDGTGFREMAAILRAQADARVESAISPAAAPAAPASTSLPTAKLAEVAAIVKKIAEPPSPEDGVKTVLHFIKKTNQALADLDKKPK